MKKFLGAIIIAIIILSTLSCSSLRTYYLDEYLPELIDITTQYPYTESITVTEVSTGKTVDFTTGEEMDNIRMQFEGIECTRHDLTENYAPAYEVCFRTTDGDVILGIASTTHFIIGEYRFSSIALKFDLFYFEKLFED